MTHAFLPLLLAVLTLQAPNVMASNEGHPHRVRPVQTGVYQNGNPKFIPALSLIREARKSIDIEIYEMEDVQFIEAVRTANKNGVKVRIIKDGTPVPKEDQCLWFETDPVKNAKAMPSCLANVMPMIQEIQAKGGSVVPFNKLQLCGQDEHPSIDGNFCYEHGKLIIVDDKKVLISTGNFNAGNFCDVNEDPKVCNRDFSYVTQKNSHVKELKTIFENDLKQVRYPLHPIVAGDPSRTTPMQITVSPYSLDPLVQFIKENGMGPGHTIQIENQYLKEANLNQAIQDAAKSGASVEVMVASLCSFGPPPEKTRKQELALYQGFIDAGVKFKYFPAGIKVAGRPGYLHAKVIVIDQKKAWVGSVNGSKSALSTNREFGIFVQRKRFSEKLARDLKADFENAQAEDFDQSFQCLNDK